MITDQETNLLYLSPLLEDRFPNFYKEFIAKLDLHNVDYMFLEHTKDVWCRDYMPIQTDIRKYVFSKYNPPYLKSKKDRLTISDNVKVAYSMNLGEFQISPILIEGGNVVKSKNKIICTSRVIDDNSDFEPNDVLDWLKRLFKDKEIIIIPETPNDFTGHADGMVRFLNENTVLINDYSKEEDRGFVDKLYKILRAANLKPIEIPTSIYENTTFVDASGCYINYLQIGKLIFLPTFNREEDKEVEKMFQKLFEGHTVVPVLSNELAKEGGVLNCCTWNIKK